MALASDYSADIVKVGPDASVHDVAEEMDEHSVGSVVVVDTQGRLLGIVTDRDLMRRVMAPGRDPEKTPVSEVMTRDLVTGRSDELLPDLIDRMRNGGIRRLPLVDDGRLVGLLALDDVVLELSNQLGNIANAIRGELREARRWSGARRRQESHQDTVELLQREMLRLSRDTRERVRSEIAQVFDRLRAR